MASRSAAKPPAWGSARPSATRSPARLLMRTYEFTRLPPTLGETETGTPLASTTLGWLKGGLPTRPLAPDCTGILMAGGGAARRITDRSQAGHALAATAAVTVSAQVVLSVTLKV